MRELDRQDISTHGLTFAIKTNHEIFLFAAITIEKNFQARPTLGDHYTIQYAKNFNPNNIVYLPMLVV